VLTKLDKPTAETPWIISEGELHAILAVLLVVVVLATMCHHFIRHDEILKCMA
jgi:cytochrome b561